MQGKRPIHVLFNGEFNIKTKCLRDGSLPGNDLSRYVITAKLLNPVLQHAMGTKLAKLKMFLERNELFSTGLPTQSMMFPQRLLDTDQKCP
jgi:hypothetical protein